jgi:IPT/TIG domain.
MKNYFLILFAVVCILSSCKDAEIQSKEYPLIVTKEVSDINTGGATLDAEILVQGTAPITDFGFILSDGTSTLKLSTFNSNKFKTRILTDLKPKVNYVCKAYLTTAQKLVYGNAVGFISLGSTPPLISDFNPKTGFDGDTVKLRGKYFSSFAANNRIYVNNIAAQIIASTDSSIVFITPFQPFIGAADITLETNTIKVTSTQKFTLVGPQINSISSLSETSGKVVAITGTNLIHNGSNITINFGQYNAEILNMTNNRIDVVVPIPYLNLLADNYTTIKLTNGLKTLTYSSDFIIKKSWKSKSPPLLFNWPTSYQSGFTYNGKGYMHDVNYGNMYEYNPLTDSWKQFGTSPFPSAIYTKSLYIQSNDKVFRVGGIDYLYNPVNYLWSYNLIANKWTMKNNLPFSFSDASYFTLENQIYILTYEGQLWQCDFENEQYKRLKDFPAKFMNYFVSTFIANGNAYAVQYGKTWLYDKQNDNWIQKASNIFYKETYSVYAKCFTYNNTGYVLNNGTDLYKYDFVNDRWIYTTKYPNVWGSNSEKSIFIIGNEVYIAATFSNYQAGAPFMYLYME